MPIKGLSSGFQFSNAGLHSINQSIGLMFPNGGESKVSQPIIRFNSLLQCQ